jgi:hypothetical protein
LRRSVTKEELADNAVSGFAVLPVIKGIPVVAASVVTVISVGFLVLLVHQKYLQYAKQGYAVT